MDQRDVNSPMEPNPTGPSSADAVAATVADTGISTSGVGEGRKTWRVGTLVYSSSGLVALFCWLLWGDFAWSMKERGVMAIFQVLLTQHEASNTTMAVLLAVIPAVLGLFLVPIASYMSDRHRSPRGRRIPYLLATTPVAAIAIAAVAFSPALGAAAHQWLGPRSPGLHQMALIFLGTFWIIFEIATVIANSLFLAFVNDVVPQTLLGRFFGLFRMVSLLVGIVFNFWLFEYAEEHYIGLFLIIAGIYGIGFTSMCYKVKEGEYPPPPPAPPGQKPRGMIKRFMDATRVYFSECYTHPYYLWIFLALGVAMVTFAPINYFSVPYAMKLGISMKHYGAFAALTYLISMVLSYFLGALADRFHPLRVGVLTLLLYAVATVFCSFIIQGFWTFAVALVTHGVLSGTFFTVISSLPQRLFPSARFAQFASASNIVHALLNIVGIFAVGRVLDYLDSDYSYTFLFSGSLGFTGTLLLIVVHKHFVAHGGVKNYVAP